MASKPNHRFERLERERLKKAKEGRKITPPAGADGTCARSKQCRPDRDRAARELKRRGSNV